MIGRKLYPLLAASGYRHRCLTARHKWYTKSSQTVRYRSRTSLEAAARVAEQASKRT